MAYLNSNFEKIDVIEVDDLIADAIIELNKKGYKTVSSCSGHAHIEFHGFELPLDKKEEAIERGDIIYDEGDKLYGVMPSISTYTYIKFLKGYNFDTVPEGYVYETAEETYAYYKSITDLSGTFMSDALIGDTIRKRISLVDSNGHNRPFEEVDSEIRMANKDLLIWAKSLKPVYENKKLI